MAAATIRPRRRYNHYGHTHCGSTLCGSHQSPPARPKAGAIGKKAAARYQELEKETTIAPVKYETFARPKETPIDLQGRPMVAPATDSP